MMSHVENRSFWWILELIYILYLSRRCLVSQLKDLSNQSKKAPEIGENATREKNVSPLSGAKEDLVVDEATKGQIGKRTDDRTEKQTQVQQKLSLSPSKYMSFHLQEILGRVHG